MTTDYPIVFATPYAPTVHIGGGPEEVPSVQGFPVPTPDPLGGEGAVDSDSDPSITCRTRGAVEVSNNSPAVSRVAPLEVETGPDPDISTMARPQRRQQQQHLVNRNNGVCRFLAVSAFCLAAVAFVRTFTTSSQEGGTKPNYRGSSTVSSSDYYSTISTTARPPSYYDNPHYFGPPPQKLSENGVVRFLNYDSNLCIGILAMNTNETESTPSAASLIGAPVGMSLCDKEDTGQLWHYNVTSGHLINQQQEHHTICLHLNAGDGIWSGTIQEGGHFELQPCRNGMPSQRFVFQGTYYLHMKENPDIVVDGSSDVLGGNGAVLGSSLKQEQQYDSDGDTNQLWLWLI